MSNAGKLYLIPSIIAAESQDSIPEATTSIIKSLDYFLVENVRSARRYISSLKLSITIEDLQFEVYDKKTSFEDIINLLLPIQNGKNGGVISEAGCPGIADPGSLAVSAAHQFGIQVVPLVGPSSIFMALMASGFSGQSFAFHGYLPIDKSDRIKKIKEIERHAIKSEQTQIFMETPYRNDQLLEALIKTCNTRTRLCVAANLNSTNEMIKNLSIQKWKNEKTSYNKIPVIFLLGT
ncbi:MAG: SAM-dependent methyltransferase [Cyclobacteriaceae bacterium]